MPSRAVLKINQLLLSVHLGCTAEERANRQEVSLSFQIRLGKIPQACESDELSETICYETLIASIHQTAESRKEFNTVEKLAQDFFATLKKQLPADAHLLLSLQKTNPPIRALKGGVHFELSDEGFHS